MVKRILIPLDPSPYSRQAVETGCRMARATGAEATGLVLVDVPGLEPPVGPAPREGAPFAHELAHQIEADVARRIDGLLDGFRARCQALGVTGRVAHRLGRPGEQLLAESNVHDLVVAGLRTHFQLEAAGGAGQPLDDLLDHSVTPVLAVPETGGPLTGEAGRPASVLVAYNGSLPAVRGLHSFAQLLLAPDMAVTLLMCCDSREEAEPLLAGAAAYLTAHGCRRVRQEWSSRDVVSVIQEGYVASSDLFVVGAHSRRGLFDFMVGSLTRFLIRHAHKPVLIGQ